MGNSHCNAHAFFFNYMSVWSLLFNTTSADGTKSSIYSPIHLFFFFLNNCMFIKQIEQDVYI